MLALPALRALPIAWRPSPRIVAIEKSRAELTDDIARKQAGSPARDDEALLQQPTRLAAQVDCGLTASRFRFGACRAYFEQVSRRVRGLRESRLDGVQTIEGFVARRFTPAGATGATCATVSQRLHDRSERVAQASVRLSTRAGIACERQKQPLRGSRGRRTGLQLRLQQTVETLTVAVIGYGGAGLAGHVAKALKAAGARIEPDLAGGIVIRVVAVRVLLAVRRARSAAEPMPHAG